MSEVPPNAQQHLSRSRQLLGELIDVLQGGEAAKGPPLVLMRILIHVVNMQKETELGPDDLANAGRRLTDFATRIESLPLDVEAAERAGDKRDALVRVFRDASKCLANAP